MPTHAHEGASSQHLSRRHGQKKDGRRNNHSDK